MFTKWRHLIRKTTVLAAAGGVSLATISNHELRYPSRTVLAKDGRTILKVYGFRGSPDTHALLTYLSWKKIPFEFINVNPFNLADFGQFNCETRTLEDLPITCFDEKNGVYVNGSSESISFIETKSHFAAEEQELSWVEVNEFYPRVEVKWQDRQSAVNKFLYVKRAIMNKYLAVRPPVASRDLLDEEFDKRQEIWKNAREIANSAEMKQALMDLLHQSYSMSARTTKAAIADAEWPFHSKIFFTFMFTILTKRNADKFNEEQTAKQEKAHGGANQHNTLNDRHIPNLIAQIVIDLGQLKGKDKFFGGRKPNHVDLEIYGLLNFIDTFDGELFGELARHWVLEKWYRRVQTTIGLKNIEKEEQTIELVESKTNKNSNSSESP